MIVDVDLVVFNCVFSRALDLNLYYIKDIISHIIVHIILFFEKKAPGRPGGFTQDAASFNLVIGERWYNERVCVHRQKGCVRYSLISRNGGR